jgi:hypothetical protein
VTVIGYQCAVQRQVSKDDDDRERGGFEDTESVIMLEKFIFMSYIFCEFGE